jgi:2-keto-3-deoxy-galactonokinase
MKELEAMVIAGLSVQVSQEGYYKWVTVHSSDPAVKGRQFTVQSRELATALQLAYSEARLKGWVR